MLVIGLTGGIASGKSTAARFLSERGASVIDADRLGHRVYEPGSPGFAAVVREFGDDVVGTDGAIDRGALGGKVFGRPERLRRLTDIVWPEIRALAQREIAELAERDPEGVAVLEAAVLLEAGWEDLADEIWVVLVETETAIARLADRNSLTREQALARIESQLGNDEHRELADVAIENSGTLDELHARLEREWRRLDG
ncbi:MAG: dephospho-CoA kinase [Proteobacteria bacterium]|nr:dephospho-CoA kinase [Pseudomonadota bacterium]